MHLVARPFGVERFLPANIKCKPINDNNVKEAEQI